MTTPTNYREVEHDCCGVCAYVMPAKSGEDDNYCNFHDCPVGNIYHFICDNFSLSRKGQ